MLTAVELAADDLADDVDDGDVDALRGGGEQLLGADLMAWSVSTPMPQRPLSRAAWMAPRPHWPATWKMTSEPWAICCWARPWLVWATKSPE